MSKYVNIPVHCIECKKPMRVEWNHLCKVWVCNLCERRKVLIDRIDI